METRLREILLVAVVVGATLPACGCSHPAQPPTEAQIAQEFKVAAPGLYKEWVSRVKKDLSDKKILKGKEMRSLICPNARYIEWSTCEMDVIPSNFKLDVKRNDSILNPFLGTLTVKVSLECESRKLVAPNFYFWTEKHMQRLVETCSGKTYEECLAGKAAVTLEETQPGATACVGGPDRKLTHQQDTTLEYNWSGGQWQFQAETTEPALPLDLARDRQ